MNIHCKYKHIHIHTALVDAPNAYKKARKGRGMSTKNFPVGTKALQPTMCKPDSMRMGVRTSENNKNEIDNFHIPVWCKVLDMSGRELHLKEEG